MKPYDIELLDVKSGEILSGFLVFADSHMDARIKAHGMEEIASDPGMSKYMVYSTCEYGKPDEKKTYCQRLSDEGTNLTVYM